MTENPNDREIEQDSDSEEDEEEVCECGYDKNHHMVSAIPTYTAWGHFWINLMGVSSVPIRIDFQCRRCKDKFAFTTDPKELKKHL